MKKESRKDNMVKEPVPDYGQGEADLLRTALKRSYTERFEMMTRLMKMNIMLQKATITHKPSSGPSK